MASTTEARMTAEDYLRLPDAGQPTELVRGVVVTMNPPNFRQGKVCGRTDRLIGNFVDDHDLGHVTCNDSGIITERDPDTVRGADVAYYSYTRIPKGQDPEGYPDVAPDIAFEVLSPTDRWTNILEKIAEYLAAGVSVVCVLDPDAETVSLFFPDRPVRQLSGDEDLTFPGILDGFHVPVRRFFQ